MLGSTAQADREAGVHAHPKRTSPDGDTTQREPGKTPDETEWSADVASADPDDPLVRGFAEFGLPAHSPLATEDQLRDLQMWRNDLQIPANSAFLDSTLLLTVEALLGSNGPEVLTPVTLCELTTFIDTFAQEVQAVVDGWRAVLGPDFPSDGPFDTRGVDIRLVQMNAPATSADSYYDEKLHDPRRDRSLIMPSSVPVIDLAPWFSGDEAARADVAAKVDAALRSVGFFLISGHGVPDDLRARVRAEARAFFALPSEAKQRYAVTVGGRGWLPPGVEANGYAEGTQTPPDLKESFAVGADQPTGDPDVDGYWFQPNIYPAEVPALQPAVVAYLARMRVLADELLVLCAAAPGLEHDFFTRHTGHATHTMNINWYPPVSVAGEPEPGQFRIGPHTDFGTVTILDREPGRGGLQVWTEEDGWEDAPYVPGAFTINTGDLLARWSGGRWKSNRHRVLPPQAEAPDEDLVSLVYFYEADHDAVIESLQPPIGKPNDYEPVLSAQFLKTRLDAITIG